VRFVKVSLLRSALSILTEAFLFLQMEGKKEFYKKAKEALESEGYRYYGEDDIKGIGSSHMSKPDYIAVKGNILVIGEIKSPKEGPTSASWRQIQNSDGEEFKKVRLEVAEREKLGLISKEVGGHEIIIRGQISDYIEKIGITYHLPSDIFELEFKDIPVKKNEDDDISTKKRRHS